MIDLAEQENRPVMSTRVGDALSLRPSIVPPLLPLGPVVADPAAERQDTQGKYVP